MANITINTQSPAYQNRLNQYNDIMAFWKPLLQEYFKMDRRQQQAWRQNDPFLARILQVTRAIYDLRDNGDL